MNNDYAKRIAEAVREALIESLETMIDGVGDRASYNNEELSCCDHEQISTVHSGVERIRSLDLDAIIASVPGPWISVKNGPPETSKNTDQEFIVACRRSNGKTYVFAAHYLNEKLLLTDEDDCPEDGKPFTGWYIERECGGDYDTEWRLVCADGDEITHYAPLPAAPTEGKP